MSTPAQTPVGEDRAKIIAALRRGDTYANIVKAMRLPSPWPVKVIAKQEGIFRGNGGRVVTREELDRQTARRLGSKGKAAQQPVALAPKPAPVEVEPVDRLVAMPESDSLRKRVLDALAEHGAFSDGRALLDAVRGHGDETINMDRLGTLLYKMRKEDLIRADEHKSANGASGDHGSTRLTNVRLSARMAKADPELAKAIYDTLHGTDHTFIAVEALRDEVRKTRPSATRGEVILALRDLKAGGRVEYDSRRVGPVDVIGYIRATGHSAMGNGPVTREVRAPVAPPTPAPVAPSILPDALGRWPRLAELRSRAVEARAKARAASKLVDAAALLEDVDPEAFDLLMARAEAATKVTLTQTEEEYLTFADDGGSTRCVGMTLPGEMCGGYRGHGGQHYPKP